MTASMNAGVATENGIELRQVARPQPGPDEILVKVAAAGMNRADLAAATGQYGGKASLGKPIGLEWAGEVVKVGSSVTAFRPGDMVMTSGSGGYAEYAVSDHARALKTGDLDIRRAAGLPLVLLTAYDAVVLNGRLRQGETVLVQGASSAVGLMAMQIARDRGASAVFGTSSNAARRARLAEFGATKALDPGDAGWADALLEATGGRGVDLVVDMVSGAAINDTMRATAVRGRVVNVGRLGGASAPFDFNLHALRRIAYLGVTFRTRSVEEVREIARAAHDALSDPVRTGKLSLPLDRTFRLSEAADALAHMASDSHFGKIVIVP